MLKAQQRSGGIIKIEWTVMMVDCHNQRTIPIRIPLSDGRT